jgi:hypothetical protein
MLLHIHASKEGSRLPRAHANFIQEVCRRMRSSVLPVVLMTNRSLEGNSTYINSHLNHGDKCNERYRGSLNFLEMHD